MIFNLNNNQMMVLDQMKPNGKISVIIENRDPSMRDHFIRFIEPKDMVSIVNLVHHSIAHEDLTVNDIVAIVNQEAEMRART